MITKINRKAERQRRHKRVRTKISGTTECPRLAVCRTNKNIENIEKQYEPIEINGISIELKNGTLSNKSVEIIIKDTNGSDKYRYGSSFRIDKKEKDNWVKLKGTGNDCSATLAAYNVNENGILEMKQDWECMYGKLDQGTYRLVKDIFLTNDNQNKKYIAVEFVIA